MRTTHSNRDPTDHNTAQDSNRALMLEPRNHSGSDTLSEMGHLAPNPVRETLPSMPGGDLLQTSTLACKWKCGPEAQAYRIHAMMEDRARGISEQDTDSLTSRDASSLRSRTTHLNQEPSTQNMAENSDRNAGIRRRRLISETSFDSGSRNDDSSFVMPYVYHVPEFRERRAAVLRHGHFLASKHHDMSSTLIQRAIRRYLDRRQLLRQTTLLIVMRAFPELDAVTQQGVRSTIMSYFISKGKRGR